MDRSLVLERPVVVSRIVAVLLGVALVTAAAQVAVPLPGTPVPMTLQPLAVLLVGGLLGARLGAASMVLYLALGIAGLPVFTPTVPLVGVARLLGPTGGYLLAYPVAAFAVGALNPGLAPGVNLPRWVRVALGVVAGLILIHLGGLAQLLILTGDLSVAARFGTLPFLLGDLIKLAVAVLILTRFTSPIRARL
jgi:biotin transport system substrate-specific component